MKFLLRTNVLNDTERAFLSQVSAQAQTWKIGFDPLEWAASWNSAEPPPVFRVAAIRSRFTIIRKSEAMSSDIEKELERTTQMRGFRYGLHDFVAHLGGAAALKKVNDNVEATYLKQGLVDRKTKELVIVAALVALKDKHSHIRIHMHAANKAGASPEEILEVLNLVAGDIGNVAKHNALEAWRITFRPDLPSIDQVIELR